ncbi:phosphotransferase [Streptococcus intermedius]|uniref:phosphotransferase n=1 Tax=Streptococcus intermedius TaxID=1338 RepID=UPI000F67E96B|nr:phosphotransferase [Streptococcus intermedius]
MKKINVVIIKILLYIFYGIEKIQLIEFVKNMNTVCIFEDLSIQVKVVVKVVSGSKIDSIKYQDIFSIYGLSPKIIKTRSGKSYVKIFKFVLFVQEYVTSSKRTANTSEIVDFLKYFYGKLDKVRDYLSEVTDIYPLYKREVLNHRFHLIHGDLRPPNVIVTKDSFSVIDFEYLGIGIRESEILKYIILICRFHDSLVEKLYHKCLEKKLVEMSIKEATQILLYDLLKSTFPERDKDKIQKNYFIEITYERENLIKFCNKYLKRKESKNDSD